MAAHHHPPLGDIAIVDRSKGLETVESMRQLTFATGRRVTKGRHWRDTNWHPGDRFCYKSFADPFPINSNYSLVADGRTGSYWISLLSHKTGKATPIYTATQGFNPVPLSPREPPHALPGNCPQKPGFGTFFVQDVYQGLLRQGVKRGQVKYLRIMRQMPKKYNTEGKRYHDHYPIIGQGTYYVKYNYGIVPVDSNGAAYFRCPSNVEIYFQALDENYKEIIRMGSVTQITTGENTSCIGCHEDRLKAPSVNRSNFARLQRKPDTIHPPPWGQGPVDYVKHVQPILDKYCIKCHSGPKPQNGINLTDDKTRFYNASYESLVFRGYVDYYYINLGPTGNFPARSTGSWVSKLTKMLESRHGKIDMPRQERRAIYAWIDANVPYYGTWDMSRPHSQGGRDATTIPSVHGRPIPAPWVKPFETTCRKYKLKLRLDDINFTHPPHTPKLMQALAESGGGLAKNSPLFKTTRDPGYVEILKLLEQARDTLNKHPRIDMGGKAIPQSRDFGRVY